MSKPNNIWTYKELIDNGIPDSIIDHVLKKLREAKQAGEASVRYREYDVPTEDIVLLGDPDKPIVGIVIDRAKGLIQHIQETDASPVWALAEFAAKGMPSKAFSTMIRKLKDQAEANADQLQYRNAIIPRSALRKAPGKNGFGVDAKYAPVVLAEYLATKVAKVEKPENTWGYSDFTANGLPKNLVDNLTKILKAAKLSEQDADYRGMGVPVEEIFLYGDPKKPMVSVVIERAKKLIAHALETEKVPSNVMTQHELGKGLGIDPEAAAVIIKGIKDDLVNTREHSIYYKNLEMPQGIIVQYYVKGLPTDGIMRPYGHAIIEDRRLLQKEQEGYLTTTEFAEAAGLDIRTSSKLNARAVALQILEKIYSSALGSPDGTSINRGITFSSSDFKELPDYQYGKRLLIKAELGRQLAEKIKLEREQKKPEGGLGAVDLKDLGISVGDVLVRKVRQQFDEGSEIAVYRDSNISLKFPREALVEYYIGGTKAWSFTKEHSERIISAYIAAGKKISLEALEAKGITPPSAQPLSLVLEKAEKFVGSALQKNPPHTLFCAFIDPAVERETPIELRMYRWGDNPNGEGGVIIHRPPLACSIKTGGSLAYAAALLSEVEDRILATPGVDTYRKLNNRRIQFGGGDELIPNAEPINGDGLGVIEEKKGTYHLRLQYGPPNEADISINLGLVHTPENLDGAYQRADAARQHIQDLHMRGAVATRLGVTDWLSSRFEFQSPYSNEHTRRISVDFPTPGASHIIIHPPHFEGTPSSMWKARFGFEFNGRPITGENASRILPFHILDGDKTLNRLMRSARLVKSILEAQAAGGGQWALDAQGRILQRQDDPTRPHDVDAIRLRDICNLAARYELEHEVVEARPRMIEEQGDKQFLAVTLGLRRTHRGELTEERFSERIAPNAPAEPLERNVYIPIRADNREAAYERADEFVQRVRELVDTYLNRDYANFNPVEMRLRRPKPYQPSSFRNLLDTAIDTAITDEFRGFRRDLPNNGNGGVDHPNGPPFDRDYPSAESRGR